ncbi:MAG: DNA adenine methylase [Acidobacteriota bacterium]
MPPAPRPFLKWAGGKTQLLPDLLARLPGSFEAYHEPFIGAGALLFALVGHQAQRQIFLSDRNEPLIDTYLAVQEDVEAVISRLRRHRNTPEHFYAVRAKDTRRMTRAGRAARLIYLNRTCFNGLYRENRSGRFNVPFGRYKNPRICNADNLRAVAAALANTRIECGEFAGVLGRTRAGDLVYFDPPYHPVSATASFTSYDRNGFRAEDQIRLRDTFAELDRQGVRVMLSNSDTAFVRELYTGFEIAQVSARRAINSRADRRGKVAELIVRNYTT